MVEKVEKEKKRKRKEREEGERKKSEKKKERGQLVEDEGCGRQEAEACQIAFTFAFHTACGTIRYAFSSIQTYKEKILNAITRPTHSFSLS